MFSCTAQVFFLNLPIQRINLFGYQYEEDLFAIAISDNAWRFK